MTREQIRDTLLDLNNTIARARREGYDVTLSLSDDHLHAQIQGGPPQPLALPALTAAFNNGYVNFFPPDDHTARSIQMQITLNDAMELCLWLGDCLEYWREAEPKRNATAKVSRG